MAFELVVESVRKIKLPMQVVFELDYAVLRNLTKALSKAGIWITPALAGTYQKANKALCDVVPIAPHWTSIENIVGDVKNGVDG